MSEGSRVEPWSRGVVGAAVLCATVRLEGGATVQPVDLAPLDVETRRVTIRGRVTDASTARALRWPRIRSAGA